MSVAEFAKKSGSSYHRTSRLLRGEVVMRLEDIAIADLILDEISEFALTSAQKRRDRENTTTSPDGVRSVLPGAFRAEPGGATPAVAGRNTSAGVQANQAKQGERPRPSGAAPSTRTRPTADEMKLIARKRNAKGA